MATLDSSSGGGRRASASLGPSGDWSGKSPAAGCPRTPPTHHPSGLVSAPLPRSRGADATYWSAPRCPRRRAFGLHLPFTPEGIRGQQERARSSRLLLRRNGDASSGSCDTVGREAHLTHL